MITEISVAITEDGYVVTCTFDRTQDSAQPSAQQIFIPFEAIPNRKEFYGLQSDEEAIRYILREHYARLNGKSQLPPVNPATGRRRSWEELTPAERMQAIGVGRHILVEPFEMPVGGGPRGG